MQDDASRWLLDHVEWVAGIVLAILGAAAAHVLGFWYPSRKSFDRLEAKVDAHIEKAVKHQDLEQFHARLTGAKSLMESHARMIDDHTHRLDVFEEFGSRASRTLETRIDVLEKQWLQAAITVQRLEKWLERQEERERRNR